jgi:hypothetical protein
MNLRWILIILVCPILFAMQLGGSCSSSGGGGGYYGGGGGGGYRPPPEPPPVYYPPHDHDDGRPNRIPRGADLVYEGLDRLRWDVDQDGTVYIYSVGDNRIPWTGPVRRGQQIVVTPKEDSVYVDGRTVYRGNLERNSPHQIYITRPPGWGGGGRGGGGGWDGGRGGGGGGGWDGGRGSGGGGGRPDDNRPSSIPREARFMHEAKGNLFWNAPDDGTVWVFSLDDNRIPFTGPIRRGQEILVNPGDDRITLAGRSVYQGNLVRGGRHQIYFTSGGGSGGGGGRGGGGGSGGGGGGGRPDPGRPSSLPREARFMFEQEGNTYWNAPEDGTVWVLSIEDNRIPYTGPMRRGQEIFVNPGDDQISVAGRRVYQGNLVRGGRHQIYFAASGGGGGGGGGGAERGGGGGAGAALPRGARELASGRGDISIGSAPRDGVVYVYDIESRRVLYSGNIGRGNSFQIFPGQNYVNLNSKRHATVQLPRGRNYALYFTDR